MCGILGRMVTKTSGISFSDFKNSLKFLYRLSESRGKEASGLCCMTDKDISILRTDIRASKLIISKEYEKCLKILDASDGRFAMGHARMVTNGDSSNPNNNQPVIRDDLVLIHNGIIVNHELLWKENSNLKRNEEVDTEIFAALLEKYKYKDDFLASFFHALSDIDGSLTIALIDKKSDWLFLYTNTGSLYVGISTDKDDYIFASERYILEKVSIREQRKAKRRYEILHVEAKQGLIINIDNGRMRKLSENNKSDLNIRQGNVERKVSLSSIYSEKTMINVTVKDEEKEAVKSLIDIDIEKIHGLKRCTRCLLPETFPGIAFDSGGVCSICNSYKQINPLGKNAFIEILEKNHKKKNHFNCISPISGGRDSSYILHYLVKVLRQKPVAYTYDWGLVTDLARRNIQRMCASLGVEHILISADIKRKRENVRKNIEAWLKKPSLGTVPLFMAGDKHFFYYAQLLKRQMQVDNVVFGMNALEETQFKARFACFNISNKGGLFLNFSSANKVKLFAAYGKEFIVNPAYINSSLLDSFTGFLSYLILPPEYFKFFDYIPWDQRTIEDTLINEYGWETAPDTDETWRIGDGTAPFYNYIYYRLAGFTEFDTFKSNQIREGMITRKEALATIDESNRIPVEGFLWYCRMIGIDPIRTLKIINRQKPLYEA